jgi:maltose O-acetyltransferase
MEDAPRRGPATECPRSDRRKVPNVLVRRRRPLVTSFVSRAIATRPRVARLVRRCQDRLRGYPDIDVLVAHGLRLGRDVYIGPGAIIDPAHCWLVSIGDESTLTPGVLVLAHDASTKRHLGYTRVARVTIGRRVFVGARAIVLSGVTVGDDVIIAAGSVVNRDVPAGTVVGGNPARVIGQTEEYIARHREQLAVRPRYHPWTTWTWAGGIDADRRARMWDDLSDGVGYVE